MLYPPPNKPKLSNNEHKITVNLLSDISLSFIKSCHYSDIKILIINYNIITCLKRRKSMKNYLIIYSENEPSLLNDELQQRHINFLDNLATNGFLLLSGTFKKDGSTVFSIRANS